MVRIIIAAAVVTAVSRTLGRAVIIMMGTGTMTIARTIIMAGTMTGAAIIAATTITMLIWIIVVMAIRMAVVLIQK